MYVNTCVQAEKMHTYVCIYVSANVCIRNVICQIAYPGTWHFSVQTFNLAKSSRHTALESCVLHFCTCMCVCACVSVSTFFRILLNVPR